MFIKRLFDIFCALFLLITLSWVIVIGWLAAVYDTGTNGLFIQTRIGQYSKPFKIYKLRTMQPETGKISAIGKVLRKSKVDELPQLVNVLLGDMSMVGPRPDLPGYYNELKGEDRVLLTLKPGITGPASLKYAKEEQLLQNVQNPADYNNNVIFPDKVRINRAYMERRSLYLDIKIMIYTVLGKKLEEDIFN